MATVMTRSNAVSRISIGYKRNRVGLRLGSCLPTDSWRSSGKWRKEGGGTGRIGGMGRIGRNSEAGAGRVREKFRRFHLKGGGRGRYLPCGETQVWCCINS